jgi:hypothetical protein
MKQCITARLPGDVETLLTSLKTMGVKFNFVVHDNFCEGDCSFCKYDGALYESVYPVKARIFTNHIDKNRAQPDWAGVKKQYETIFQFDNYPVSLPPNYRDILNADNYEFLIQTWISNDCETVVAAAKNRLAEYDKQIADVSSEITREASLLCTSSAKKNVCTTGKRNVQYKCGKTCKTKMFGICLDKQSIYCNRVEDYAVCGDVNDYDTQAAEIKACDDKKELNVKALKKALTDHEERKATISGESRYGACLRTLSVK